MAFAPVALFVYNRALHVERTLEGLVRNVLAPQTPLVVFSDGPKSEEDIEAVQAVRTLIKRGWGFGSVKVVEAGRNKGLARSIIEGVTEVLREHDRVIVIEDDIVTAPATLEYFNAALAYYRDTSAVFSISAYSHPASVMPLPKDYDYDAYFIPRMMCWGWATWKDRWAKADWSVPDFDDFIASPSAQRAYVDSIGRDSLGTLKAYMAGKKDVWACRWVYTHFKHRAVCVCPTVSYVDNIGLDGSGANCNPATRLKNDLADPYPDKPRWPAQVFVDPAILATFMNVYDGRLRRAATPPKRVPRRSLRSFVTRLRTFLAKLPERLLARLSYTPSRPVVRLGTQYGGWHVLEGMLGEGDTVVSAGAGEDISFDVELAQHARCRIHLLDPTPRAMEHFKSTCRLITEGNPAPINNSEAEFYKADSATVDRLVYHPLGLWKRNVTLRFYEPKNKQHVSHSIGNLQSTSGYFDARCVTVQSFLKSIGILGEVGAIKMDIEGAEFAVLRSMLVSRIRPKLLMVEFHAGQSQLEKEYKLKTLLHILLLQLFGYRLIVRSGWNFVFARCDQLATVCACAWLWYAELAWVSLATTVYNCTFVLSV